LVSSTHAVTKEDDLVTELVNMTSFNDWNMYSGMLDINETTKQLHYMLAET
jgi:hypothetical protein